jgi:hypothetical protein
MKLIHAIIIKCLIHWNTGTNIVNEVKHALTNTSNCDYCDDVI